MRQLYKFRITFLFFILMQSTVLLAQMAVHDSAANAQNERQSQYLQNMNLQLINQVSQLKESIRNEKAQIKETLNVKDEIATARTEMSTLYNNTFGLIGEVKGLIEEIQKTPSEIEQMINEFKKNTDCMWEDMESYKKKETLYTAKYVFREGDGKPRHEFADGSDKAGSDSPWQMENNPCGMQITYYDQLIAKRDAEKAEIMRIEGKRIKTKEELVKEKYKWDQLSKKVEGTQTLKETNDTMKTLLFQLVKILKEIEQSVDTLTKIALSATHNPEAVAAASRVKLDDSKRSYFIRKNEGMGKATEFHKWLDKVGTLKKDSSVYEPLIK